MKWNVFRFRSRSPLPMSSLFAEPIRAELLGTDHLARVARELAKRQRLADRGRGSRDVPLLARLDSTERILNGIHARLATGVDNHVDLGSAGEWLLDNFHVLAEHIREVRATLPSGYYRELPKLGDGLFAGYPRVYELAVTLITNTEGQIDFDHLDLFFEAFQEDTYLTIGELWAVPAMLRLALTDNIRRMGLRTVHRLDEVLAADQWIARVRTSGDEGALPVALSELAQNPLTRTAIFTTRLLRRLHEEHDDTKFRRSLERWILDEGLRAEDAETSSREHLALTELMMANSITSLRNVARMDWRTFVERRSMMEATLKEDPSGYYPNMTFETRDRYRHVVEEIARRTSRTEVDVGRIAVDLARNAAGGADGRAETADQALRGDGTACFPDLHRTHVGYYLIDEGRKELERATGYHPAAGEEVRRWVLRYPLYTYFGGILTCTAAIIIAILWMTGVQTWISTLLILLLAGIPASEVAVSIVNQLTSVLLPPQPLARLDFQSRGEIPAAYRTAVVIPTLLEGVEAVHNALENLEVQFLANREKHLHFVLLSDFTDASNEVQEGDAAIVAAAESGVRALNTRYAAGTQDAFYLFHRSRRWNPREAVWMGWERKRGKLTDFNGFLRGTEGAFSTIVGDPAPLRRVRYVITLDADTVLPPDGVPRLVGALAHPLNRAVYDASTGRVVRGYGILQPRVDVSLPSANITRFAAIHSGRPGVDPYTAAVSDVYQDLFREGSYTGKGIYDLDVFEQATEGRFAENTLLSHDLIEGIYARTGLATDVVVYDDYPARYLTFTRRKHRWIRGDWQLLGWLIPGVPGPDRQYPRKTESLSLLSRWKIVDNLRRSTVEVGLVSLLLVGWTILPGSPLLWTVLVLSMLAAPWGISLLLALVRPPLDKSWTAYYAAVGRDAVASLQQLALSVVFLAHQALISADAIARTLWRSFVSRSHLLEWQTASDAERVTGGSATDVWRIMRPVSVLSGGIVLLAIGIATVPSVWFPATSDGSALPLWRWIVAVLPLAVLWLVSPAIAHVLSRPPLVPTHRLSSLEKATAMRYALLHWRYFDRFVSADTHWLVPDNFQEDPHPMVAMRTSPTNVGLQLLAITSAYDLGFVTASDMTSRLENAFESLEKMRRFRGHFFNWYDLHDLSVLEPAYVSTVDSGNLAGHLIALRQACLNIPDDVPGGGRTERALGTALTIADERLHGHDAAEALRLVRRARSALSEASEETDLERVLEPVAKASTLMRQAGYLPESPAVEWLGWIQRRIDAERQGLDGSTRWPLPDAPVPRYAGAAAPEAHVSAPPTLRQLAPTSTAASTLVMRLERLAHQAYRNALAMDFEFLYDRSRGLLSIGYHTQGHSLDSSYYDLLASESRLTSFIAVAKNDVPVEHWFSLGRTLTRASGETSLVSWSGSMFEYLMPVLVMRSFPHTLLDQTYQGAVRRQIAYGDAAGVPWGASESAFNLRDRHLTYQYGGFGVPDLALKRGLGSDLVMAPYASELAMMIEPRRALANLSRLEEMGGVGTYGFYDAVDYTRPDPGRPYAIVRNFMSHHLGMGMVALTNVLLAERWQHRFHTDALVRAAELLLYERIPRRLLFQSPQESQLGDAKPDPDLEHPAVREVHTPHSSEPRIALLGRLPYTIMVTSAGGGYSRYEELAVTRWRADGTTDDTGQFFYLKDMSTGEVWSAAHQPTCVSSDEYGVHLATDRVSFRRMDGDFETRTEITVVPEDSAEVRRVTVTNHSDTVREIELTSYCEVVLGSAAADRAHPAFSNLFVETEWHAWCTSLTATRRPRSADERRLWCVHVVHAGPCSVEPVSYETDRARFIGRGRSVREPIAMDRTAGLSGTTGAVLDPIFALRIRLRLEAGQSATAAFTTLVATTRERAFELAGRYHDPHAAQRAFDLAWASTQVELRELGITPTDAGQFQELAGRLLYPPSSSRADLDDREHNRGSQPLLWSIGLSGEWPIVLATIQSSEGLPTLRRLLSAHRYWRRRGMTVDLVIVNAHPPSYLQELHDAIVAMLHTLLASDDMDRPGGVFIRRLDELDADTLLMLRASAPIHVDCDGSVLDIVPEEPASRDTDHPDTPAYSEARRSDKLAGRVESQPLLDQAGQTKASGNTDGASVQHSLIPPANGFGRILPDGAYEIVVCGDRVPPAPWANVVANPKGGFVVTERGTGFTWAESSYFFRLSPWYNDPVADPSGEIFYLRDEETRVVWSATPAPIRRDIPFVVRHGAGYTSFEHSFDDIASLLTMAMAPDEAVKLSVLRLTNETDRVRRITVTGYVAWTLGVSREQTRHRIRTFARPELSALFAQNTFDPLFARRIAFFSMSEPVSDHSCDNRSFVGRNGSLADPAGLQANELGAGHGSRLDPCAALRCTVELPPRTTREVVFALGAADGDAEAARLAYEYGHRPLARDAVSRSTRDWSDRLSVIRVSTPDPSFDAILNHWLLYQALSCRMWARSAVYQSGGAYGFRDQLQDGLAFVYAEPEVARNHILRAAARQFSEGDVQHWWHPHNGRGIRTRISDDLAWLPYVVDKYVCITGDQSVLDEFVPFLTMRPLEPHEHEVYDLPLITDEHASVYEHCRRALDRASTAGAHGLPLIGVGDWNDGMNRVGANGRGESVWLAWFLIATLRSFSEHASFRGDSTVARDFRARADAYTAAVEAHGWDGAWYRRAYFDDGTPLGSASNAECRIDAIAQSWSVISGAGDPERAAQAMDSFEKHLVRADARLIQLLAPPFDRTPLDPGYIKGYLPGVRENGAQYTHGALWSVLATALQGRGDRAFELFQMINPLTRTTTPGDVAAYKVEPYVVAADVYSAAGHVGRGGWTWYTGSAAWMYRIGIEAILGFVKRGDILYIEPCVPAAWPEYRIEYRFGESVYAITVHDPARVNRKSAEVRLDGVLLDEPGIPLANDGTRHAVVVRPADRTVI